MNSIELPITPKLIYDIFDKLFDPSLTNIINVDFINRKYIDRPFSSTIYQQYFLLNISAYMKDIQKYVTVEFNSTYILMRFDEYYFIDAVKYPKTYEKFSIDYDNLILLIENHLNDSIESFTDNKIEYLTDDQIKHNEYEYKQAQAVTDFENDIYSRMCEEIDKEIVKSILGNIVL